MSLIHYLLDPWSWLATILILLVVSCLGGYKKLVSIFVLLLSGYSLLFLLSPLAFSLVSNKERLYLPIDPSSLDTSKVYDILVLGAGKTSDPALPYTMQLSSSGQKRLVEGFRLYRQLCKARLIGTANSSANSETQAKSVTESAIQLGVSPTDTFQLPSPINTETEAVAYYSRFGSEGKLLLVTSAIHMRRAMHLFEFYGVNPIPAPCDYLLMEDPSVPVFNWLPSRRKLDFLKAWIHEEIGLIYAKWKFSYE